MCSSAVVWETDFLSCCSSSLCSNLEYKDTPIDLAQLPNLPEKTSESSESSDSESESKENSGTIENPPRTA